MARENLGSGPSVNNDLVRKVDLDAAIAAVVQSRSFAFFAG